MSNFSTKDLRNMTQSAAGQIVQVQSVGKYKEVCVAMLGPAAYNAGGSLITAEQLGLTWINYVIVTGTVSGDVIGHVVYPNNNGPVKSVKVKVTDLAGTEQAGDLSAKEFRIIAQGTY